MTKGTKGEPVWMEEMAFQENLDLMDCLEGMGLMGNQVLPDGMVEMDSTEQTVIIMHVVITF